MEPADSGLERRPAEGPHQAAAGGVRQQGRCAPLMLRSLQTLFSWEYCEVIGQGRPQVLPGGQSLFTLFQWEKCSAVSKQRAHYSMLGDVNRPKQEHNPRRLALASGLSYFRLLV